MKWLSEFAEAASRTDRLIGNPQHVALLAAGLMGEAGSVLAELKKEQREREAYPAYRHRITEEIGDFLWYLVRLAAVLDPSLLSEFDASPDGDNASVDLQSLPAFLKLGANVGDVLSIMGGAHPERRIDDLRPRFRHVWRILVAISTEIGVPLDAAARENIQKTQSRWPSERVYTPLLDNGFPEEEQLPRKLDVEFRERSRGGQKVVILRCNGLNFGDRLTDNIQDPDGYRYHDIFHFAHAIHLGWSPVIRSLLRCKRKSSSKIDEAEDGARAVILEEAAAAVVFSRAKQLNFFENFDHIDYDLLKTVSQFIEGYEVERVPLWQWETAIIDGYRIFRKLKSNSGGRIALDLEARKLTYIPPP